VKYVLDACVAVASVLNTEKHHEACRRRMDRVLAQRDEVVVPSLFVTEVIASCARQGHADRGHRLIARLVSVLDIRAISRTFAIRAAATASNARLKGGDAIYAHLAKTLRVALVTYDEELLAQRECKTTRP